MFAEATYSLGIKMDNTVNLSIFRVVSNVVTVIPHPSCCVAFCSSQNCVVLPPGGLWSVILACSQTLNKEVFNNMYKCCAVLYMELGCYLQAHYDYPHTAAV